MKHQRLARVLGLTVLLLSMRPALAASFSVQSVFPFGPSHLAVAFSDSVDIASALRPGNYTIAPQGGAPALSIQTVQLQDNQRTVIFALTSALPVSRSYSMSVTGVLSRHADPLASSAPIPFTTPPIAATGIADIHANINSLIGQVVTIIGEVYMREASVTGAPSGYIQDATGRGLNVFGGTLIPALDTLGTVVEVTGTAALYYTTVELTGLTVTTLASNAPRLAPRVLSVAAASSAQWEGTYIQCTAKLTGAPTVSGANHYNYPASDAGTAFTFRVRNSVGVDPGSFAGNEIVTGAGAGSSFQGVYQATVGVPGDFFRGTGRGDITPPVLVAANGEGGDNHVLVSFSEPVGNGASIAANYSVYPAGNPGAPIAISSASATGASVKLTLASTLVAAAQYTVAASHVMDAAGNEIPAGSTIDFTAATPVPYEVAGVFRFGAAYVGVAFTKDVNASAATTLANYAFTPPLALADARLQANGKTVILRAAATLPASTTYHVAVANVPSAGGETLAPGGPYPFDTGSESILDIATIQANVTTYAGQIVSFVGQVTIPVGSRGGAPSGYVEDGSGHGINLYGGTIQGAVNQLGSVAKVTGTVTPYFTTTEVTSYTATGLATGIPDLAARRMSVAQANNIAWEGTFIEVTANITAITASGTSNTNYDASDAGAAITFRVGNGLGIPLGQFAVGDRVTGRGAGGSFQSTYQINIGNLTDFFLAGTGGPDTTGPGLSSATGDDGSPHIALTFDEPVSSNTATLASNYTVTPAGGSPIPVTNVVLAVNSRTATLTLASNLTGGTSYSIAISNITDLIGNVCRPGASISFVATLSAPATAQLRVPARTLIKGMSRLGELMNIEAAGLPNSKATVRIFDTQGRLVKVLFDSRLPGNGRTRLTWDARDEAFEMVPTGLYICHLLLTDPSGATSEARVPIVVAVRLK